MTGIQPNLEGMRRRPTYEEVRHEKHKKNKLLNTSKIANPIYWKRVKDQLEAASTKVASMDYRKKLLDNQKKMNYSMEYEKIRGILAHSSLPFQTLEALKERKNELKKLGARAFAID